VSLEHVVLPTLAVVLTWICVGVVLAGCGFLMRHALLRLFRVPGEGLRPADLWIGLAVLLAYLQVWSLLFRVGWETWPLPVCAGLAGVLIAGRGFGRSGLERLRSGTLSLPVLALAALGILWVANRGLGQAADYDLGLYHLNVVEYASRYGAIPGLGNLQSRLGASDAHLVLVAFLGHGPWGSAAAHLVNGLLVSMLFVEIASRFARRPNGARASSFTRRMALLLAPATVAVAGIALDYRLASPNLDLAAFVLVAAGALYLAESVENGFLPTAALTSTAAFAAAAATRPLYWPATLLAAGLLALAAKGARAELPTGLLRAVAVLCVLPGALVVGWMARQAILSGYPFFPATVGGLPVDWRVPASVVTDQNRWNEAWARWPGKGPDEVLGSWHWLGPWLRARSRDLDVIAPLILLASLVPSLMIRDEQRARRLRPMLFVLVPAAVSIVGWFLVAPDPRFVFAPIWIVPIALAAWALPVVERRPDPIVLVAAAVVTAALAVIGVHALVWLVLAAFDAWALAVVALRLFGSHRAQRLMAQAALLSLALTPIAILADHGAFLPIEANGTGPLGTPAVLPPSLVAFRTTSGLELWRPADGADQCWGAILCVPQTNMQIRLRGKEIVDGFTINP
jgi:hypothetical protein